MKQEVNEITYDYSSSNEGKTHVLIVEYPEGCDEECFLFSLKVYLDAHAESLIRKRSEHLHS